MSEPAERRDLGGLPGSGGLINSRDRRSHPFSLNSSGVRAGSTQDTELQNLSLHRTSLSPNGVDPRPTEVRVGGSIENSQGQDRRHLQIEDESDGYLNPSQCRCRTRCVCDDRISLRSEHTFIPRRDLGLFDVAALIINKQIGTGIFTTPGLVLSLTGSKTTSTILWFCGGIWSFLRYVVPGGPSASSHLTL
jgi:hypothetical protein